MSIKARLTGNLIANVFSQGVGTLIQIVSVPLFLAFWTNEQYGQWLLVSSIPTYLSLAEAGFATASANEVSIFVAEGAMRKAQRCLHSAWGFLLSISLLACVVLFPISFLLPWNSWLNVTADSAELAWVIFVLGLFTVLGLASSIFSVIYRAVFQAPRLGVLSGLCRLAELGAITFSIMATNSMLVLAVALFSVRFVTTAFLWFDVVRLSPNLRLGLSAFSFQEIQRIWKPSLMFLAGSLGNAFYYQGMTLMVGVVLGPIAVVLFNATRTLTRAIAQFAATIRHSIWPEFSYLYGARDFARARHLAEFSLEVVTVGSLVLSGILLFAGPWIMGVWTNQAVEFVPVLLAILLLGALLNGLGSVVSVPLAAANRHQRVAFWYLCGSAISLVFGFGFVQVLGLAGAAWSMVLCEAITVPYGFVAACRILEYSPRAMLANVCKFQRSRSEIHKLFRQYTGDHSLS